MISDGDLYTWTVPRVLLLHTFITLPCRTGLIYVTQYIKVPLSSQTSYSLTTFHTLDLVSYRTSHSANGWIYIRRL
ncbi:hypothetical protein XENTR_v10017673 [Xenopus tropicalis]|nr:hypothetical protein XENTR_v10017673 [Xenopus tropicalis]